MRTTSLKSTNQGELLNYVSHANKEHYSASLNSLTHSLSLTHTHTSKQASISPGCLRRWRPQPEEDVWSRKGIQKGVFLTLASTEPWTLCFNNPVNTRNRERHTVDGGGRAFPNHFDCPFNVHWLQHGWQERERVSWYTTMGKRERGSWLSFRWICFFRGKGKVRVGVCAIRIRRYPGRSPSCPAPWPPNIPLCRCAWALLSPGRCVARTTSPCSCPDDRLIKHGHTKANKQSLN